MMMYKNRATPLVFVPPLVAAVAGVGAAALLMFFTAGPRLGRLYDVLTAERPSPDVAREILLIEGPQDGETLGAIDPAQAAQIILTLAEFGAAEIALEMPVLGVSGGFEGGSDELSFQFNSEFAQISSNITNLFDAIRFGYLKPQEVTDYVDKIIGLSEKSKERLIALASKSLESDINRFEIARKVFAHVHIPDDAGLRLVTFSPPAAEERVKKTATRTYARVNPDRDGVLRRAAPLIVDENGEVVEHIMYNIVKDRYESADVTRERGALFLDLCLLADSDAPRARLPLDKNGTLIFGKKPAAFRALSVTDFLRYGELEREIYRILAENAELPRYSGLSEEKYPAFLYEKVLAAQNVPNLDEKAAQNEWKNARSDLYAACDAFFTDETAANLIENFEKLRAEEKLDAESDGAKKLAALRDGFLDAFTKSRALWAELAPLHFRLKQECAASLCIMAESAALESSALLANSLLTARAAAPAPQSDIILATAIACLLVFIAVFFLRGFLILVVAFAASGAAFFFFCARYLLSGVWLDPLIPFASCAILTLAYFTAKELSEKRERTMLLSAFTPLVGRKTMQTLIAKRRAMAQYHAAPEKPDFAAFIAVRNGAIDTLKTAKEAEYAEKAAQMNRQFHRDAVRLLTAGGAVVLSASDDVVVGAFGSPLEKAALGVDEEGKKRGRKERLRALHHEKNSGEEEASVLSRMAYVKVSVARSIRLAKNIAQNEKNGAKSSIDTSAWNIALDCGLCSFYFTRETGYTGSGRALSRVKLLASLAARSGLRLVISNDAAKNSPDAAIAPAPETLPRQTRDILRVINVTSDVRPLR